MASSRATDLSSGVMTGTRLGTGPLETRRRRTPRVMVSPGASTTLSGTNWGTRSAGMSSVAGALRTPLEVAVIELEPVASACATPPAGSMATTWGALEPQAMAAVGTRFPEPSRTWAVNATLSPTHSAAVAGCTVTVRPGPAPPPPPEQATSARAAKSEQQARGRRCVIGGPVYSSAPQMPSSRLFRVPPRA